MLTHTCIQSWFHIFAEPGSPSAENLAAGLQHGCRSSFSREPGPTILLYNFLFFNGQGNVSCPHASTANEDRCPVRQENVDSCGQLFGFGFCSSQDSRAMGLPKALPAMQSITSHHEPI